MVRINGYADAGDQLERCCRQLVGLTQDGADLCRDSHCIIRLRDGIQQYDELIPSKATDGVRSADTLHQTARNHFQNLIAGPVTVGIIYFLELVDIQVQNRQIALFPGNTGQRILNTIQNQDRKSTRLNSSHVKISYAVFCLEKKRTKTAPTERAPP